MMRNGVDYTKRDEAVMLALAKGWSGESLLQHTDSSYGYGDITEKLGPSGFNFAQVSDAWGIPYSIFVTKNGAKAGEIGKLYDASWNDVNGTKDQMYKIILPECCSKRLDKDREAEVSPTRRLALQMVDIIRRDYINPLDLFEAGAQIHSKSKEQEKPEKKEEEFVDSYHESAKAIKDANENMFLNDIESGLIVATMNIRLSNEMPMCEPGCKAVFNGYTMGRLRAVKELGYGIDKVSQNAGDYVDRVFFRHFWGEKNSSTDEIDRMIKSVDLASIKKVNEMERSRVSDDIVNLKRRDDIISQMADGAVVEKDGMRFSGKVEL